jgi:outer membrane protein W
MKSIFKTALLLFFLLLPYYTVAGEELTPRWGVGLNYPGAGIKYLFNDKLSLELRGQFAEDIVIGGLRGNYYFNPDSNAVLFIGIESDYVSFKGEESKGNGFAEELYLGIEFFLLSHFSLQVDFGPAFIVLKDKDSSLSVNGIEYVVNFGVNWYFGSQNGTSRHKEEEEEEEE